MSLSFTCGSFHLWVTWPLERNAIPVCVRDSRFRDEKCRLRRASTTFPSGRIFVRGGGEGRSTPLHSLTHASLVWDWALHCWLSQRRVLFGGRSTRGTGPPCGSRAPRPPLPDPPRQVSRLPRGQQGSPAPPAPPRPGSARPAARLTDRLQVSVPDTSPSDLLYGFQTRSALLALLS